MNPMHATPPEPQPSGNSKRSPQSSWVRYLLSLFLLTTAFWATSCVEEDKSKIDKKPIAVDNVAIELQITGTWQYAAITDSTGKEVRKVAAGDQMLLDYPEQNFNYGLSKENLSQKGTWAVADGMLVLTYQLSAEDAKKLPKERRFAVAAITDTTLKLVENGVTYAFKR